MEAAETRIPWPKILLWILCLAMVAVGARNFEEGLSIDSPLYATIARNVMRTGELFKLDPGVPDFGPAFFDHPHLGFWVMAGFLKFLPAQDWAIRFVNHLYYVAFLMVFFFLVRRHSGQKAAILSVVMLWLWSRFSNTFSSFYLDPGVLFFHTVAFSCFDLALDRKKFSLAALAGVCAGLTVMIKGVANATYLPGYLFIFTYYLMRDRSKFTLKAGLVGFACAALVVGSYVYAVLHSAFPQFFAAHWAKQLQGNMNSRLSLANFTDLRVWNGLIRDSFYLAPLGLIPLFRKSGSKFAAFLPLALVSGFIVTHVPVRLVSGQYVLAFLPWVAWLVAQALAPFMRFRVEKILPVTAVVSLAAVAVIQYLPFRTHTFVAGDDIREMKNLVAKGHKQIVMAFPPQLMGFIPTSTFAWYADVRVLYLRMGEALPPAPTDETHLVLYDQDQGLQWAKDQGFCSVSVMTPQLFYRCDLHPKIAVNP